MSKKMTIFQVLSDNNVTKKLIELMPDHVADKNRLIRIFLSEIRRNPQLMNVDPASMLKVLAQASYIGLEISSLTGKAYIVPFKNEATLIIGYKGYISLAMRSKKISNIFASSVHEGDIFDVSLGCYPKITHIPNYKKRGDAFCYYAIAFFNDGKTRFEVMTKDEIEKIRDNIDAYKYAKEKGRKTPWVTHFDEMAKKTVIRRLFKYLQIDEAIDYASAIDENHDENSIKNGFVIDGKDEITFLYQNNTEEKNEKINIEEINANDNYNDEIIQEKDKETGVERLKNLIGE